MGESQPLHLDVRNLAIHMEDRQLLAPLTLRLERGRSLGLAGPSGSGKTLAARAIAGLLPGGATATGDVSWGDQRDSGHRIGPEGVALLLQHTRSALDPLRRIRAQLDTVIRNHQPDCSDPGVEARRLLDQVGLDATLLRAYPHQLSGGQCQRVLIAMGLACRPALLIADEPTSALDSVATREILELLLALPRARDIGLMLISHDPKALAACDALIELGAPPADAQPAPPVPSAEQTRAGSILTARGLSVTLGHRPIVDGVDLDLTPGRTVAVVGRSGCGKTTLARAMLGLIPSHGDAIRLHGEPWPGGDNGQRRARRRQVQIVFQDPASALNPRQTVSAALREALEQGPEVSQRESVASLLMEVGLDPSHGERYPHQLSGGQRQRVAIARALAPQPQVLICDEPVSSLDAHLRDQLLGLLDQLRAQRNLALMLISHDLEQVRRFAHEVLVMDAGRVVESGPVERVLDSPTHPATRALVAAAASPA